MLPGGQAAVDGVRYPMRPLLVFQRSPDLWVCSRPGMPRAEPGWNHQKHDHLPFAAADEPLLAIRSGHRRGGGVEPTRGRGDRHRCRRTPAGSRAGRSVGSARPSHGGEGDRDRRGHHRDRHQRRRRLRGHRPRRVAGAARRAQGAVRGLQRSRDGRVVADEHVRPTARRRDGGPALARGTARVGRREPCCTLGCSSSTPCRSVCTATATRSYSRRRIRTVPTLAFRS